LARLMPSSAIEAAANSDIHEFFTDGTTISKNAHKSFSFV